MQLHAYYKNIHSCSIIATIKLSAHASLLLYGAQCAMEISELASSSFTSIERVFVGNIS